LSQSTQVKTDSEPTAPARTSHRGLVHFFVALALLASVAVGIYAFQRPERLPVPWPKGVRVDQQYRLITFPDRIGPYRLKDAGDVTFDEDIMRALGLGTSYDQDRRPKRCSNWYINRVYEDTRITEPTDPYKYWQFEIYYYTGLQDTVPHVPEICLEAGGVKVLGRENVLLRIPTARTGWDGGIAFRRIHYQRIGIGGRAGHQGVEYYVFSLNGKPETRREKVRLELSYPWVRHCFFAKIQFAPTGRGGIASVAQADAKAEEFMTFFLPVALRMLPTESDISRLDAAEASDHRK